MAIDLQEVQRLYETGATLREIAQSVGTSSESVRRMLIESGVPRRPRGQPVGKHRPKSGLIYDKDGYVLLRQPEHPHAVGGYVRRARIVMERSLDRLLCADEVVTHRNGLRDDDRLENLELHPSSGEMARRTLLGNTRARGDLNNPKRRVRRRRSESQLLWELAHLHWTRDRPIRRSDLHPPDPSWRAVARAFGSWQAGVERALAAYPEQIFHELALQV